MLKLCGHKDSGLCALKSLLRVPGFGRTMTLARMIPQRESLPLLVRDPLSVSAAEHSAEQELLSTLRRRFRALAEPILTEFPIRFVRSIQTYSLSQLQSCL